MLLLNKRTIKRPRRFDRVIKIAEPDENVRREFLRNKVTDLTPDILEEWVTATDGFSIAALADLVLNIKCFNFSFDDAVDRLRKMLNSKVHSEDSDNKVGFF